MQCSVLGAMLLAVSVLAANQTATAIEVTYGEDYVERPNTRGDDDFINLGYGIDPIPAKSPAIRFNDWRSFRAKIRAEKMYQRQGVQPQAIPQAAPQPSWEQIPPGQQTAPSGVDAKRVAPQRPSSRRASQTKSGPRAF
jgi:hypothetical protein